MTARRHTTLGLAVLLAVGLAAYLSTISISGLPWSSPYEVRIALPPGAPLLHAGDDVRIGGERAGQVKSVALAIDRRTVAVATLSLGAGYRIGGGAGARIRPLGLAGAVYVDLDPGNIGRPRPSGSLIQAAAGVQVTDLIGAFDLATRRALQEVLTGYGTGLAGRGVQAGNAIARAPGLLANLTATAHDLTATPGSLTRAIGDSTTLARALAPPGSDTLASDAGEAAAVAGTAGERAGAIATTIGALPRLELTASGVLPGADALLAQAGGAAHDLIPGVSALAAALPSLGRLERLGRPVATLGRLAASAAPALRALTPVLGRLLGPASGLTPLSDPVAELAGFLIPYRAELVQAPLGFTRWGGFTYDFGTGAGHRAVRFSMVLTCAHARDPYPQPGEAARDRSTCP